MGRKECAYGYLGKATLYWQTKPDVTPEVVQIVDWPAVGRSMKGVVRGRRVFVTKHAAGMCGVGKLMKRWKQWDTDQCPRCGEQEDAAHIWVCKEQGAKEVWSKSLATIELFLCKLDTDPTIIHLLMLHLNSWQSGEGVTYQPPRELEAVL
jgi:hypothetical protein